MDVPITASARDRGAGVWTRTALPCALLAAIAALHYRLVFSWPPVDPDELNALSFGAQSNPIAFFYNQLLDYLPGYRPIYALRFWLQYRLHGIEHIALYYVVQLAFLWGVACIVFVALRAFTGRIDASLLAAIATLIDKRNQPSLTWFDPLAMGVLFGLAALVIVWRRSSTVWSVAAAILLLLSALSKEFGLAFVAFLGIESFVRLVIDRTDSAAARRLVIACAAGVIYIAMRLLLAQGAAGDHCAGSGFFFESRDVCFNLRTALSDLPQWLYNIGATFVGTLLPGLFAPDGRLLPLSGILPGYFVYTAAFAALALYALLNRSREARLSFLLIACSALISFALFRERNHMVGQIGLYVAAGIGLAMLLNRVEAARWRKIAPAVIGGVAVLLLLYAYRAERSLAEYYERHRTTDYSVVNASFKNIDMNMVCALEAKYRPWMPPCP